MKNILYTFFLISLFSVVNAAIPFEFVSPVPNAKWVNPEHIIVLRPGQQLEISTLKTSDFSISGNKSGRHDFKIAVSSDSRTINLIPASPFAFDETVTVSVYSGIVTSSGSKVRSWSYTFSTHRAFTAAEKERFRNAQSIMQEKEMKRWNSGQQNDANPPQVQSLFDIPININPTPGDIFFDTWSAYGVPSKWTGYAVISNSGDSLFQRKMGWCDDFKQLKNGYFGVYNGDWGRFDVLDSNFNVIDSYYPANGYYADNHEFQMLPEGHALFIAQDYEVVDMTVYNPNYSPNATVVGGVIQEFDENKTLVFEWRAFDHIEITEALHEDLSASFIDYTHTNALDIDNDGNILVSNRHLDQINKIDRNTGDFIWRMGGVKNEFTFTNDPEKFTYQHDVRRIEDGNITLFDNGNWHAVPHSTAKEYELDEVNKTATLVWSYSHPDGNGGKFFYWAMGSVQRLSNGNTFINWGWRYSTNEPSMTEVTADGTIVWELHLTDAKAMVAYRSHKYDYSACARPTFQKLRNMNVTATSATLKWSPAWGVVKYALQYAELNSNMWTQKVVNGNNTSKTITGLTPSTTYKWRMQTWCDGSGTIASGFTPIKKFQTPPLKSLTEESSAIINVYPNPAHDNVSISLGNLSVRELVIRNLTGQEIRKMSLPGDNNGEIHLSLKGIPSGIYFIELISDGSKEIRQLIVE